MKFLFLVIFLQVFVTLVYAGVEYGDRDGGLATGYTPRFVRVYIGIGLTTDLAGVVVLPLLAHPRSPDRRPATR